MENNNTEDLKNAQQTEQQETPQKTEIEIAGENNAELESQIASLKDQLLRKAAEFENYKRRT